MKRILSVLLGTVLALTFTTSLAAELNNNDELPVTGWVVTASTVNENNGKKTELPEYVTDGNLDTHWITMINPKAEGPHWIQMELPELQEAGGLRYYPRPGARAGTCTVYEIYASADGKKWTNIASGSWEATDDAKEASFNGKVKAKYFRLTIIEGVSGFGSAAEIRLIKPKSGAKEIGLTGSVALSGAAEEQETVNDELSVKNWIVTASTVNANNGVLAEVPEYVTDGKLDTHWITMINPKAEEPHWLDIELPAEKLVGGFRYYPRPGAKAGTCTKYEISASDNHEAWVKIAEGTWNLDEKEKTVYFSHNVKATFFRLTIIEGAAGFGSAAEIRLIKPDSKKESKDLSGNKVEFVEAVEEEENEQKAAELPVTGWTVTASTVNENNGKKTEPPEYVTDGNLDTHWITMINPKAEGPHWLLIELPSEQSVSGLRYYPRPGAKSGTCTEYEISVSADGKDFVTVAEGKWNADEAAKDAYFGFNIKTKYVKLLMKQSTNGYGSAAEIRLLAEEKGQRSFGAGEYVKNYGDYHMTAASFANTAVTIENSAQSYPAGNLLDGKRETLWCSEQGNGKLPINIDFKFNYAYTIEGIRYIPRQDNTLLGHFQKFEVFTSDDGESYASVGEYSISEASAAEKDVLFENRITAKYLRITLKAGRSGCGSAAEIMFLQTDNQYARDAEAGKERYVLKIGSEEINTTRGGEASTVKTDVAPFTYKGSTMIPLRGLLELMGAEVSWNGEEEKINVKTAMRDITFQVENDRVIINGVRYNVSVAPMIVNSRTFIPLRFVSENLGYDVSWNGAEQTITITN